MRNILEKFGAFGTVLTAAACPICFPKLALIGAVFGLGALTQYETIFFFTAQALFVFALIGHVISYGKVRNKVILLLAVTSTMLFFLSLYLFSSELFSYISMVGMVSATLWMIIENRKCPACNN